MIVKFKQTGQLGEIPDDKFDPNLFDRADAPVAPTPQAPVSPTPQVDPEQAVRKMAPQKSFSEKVGSGIIGLGKNLANPFIRTGKNILGAGAEVERKAGLDIVNAASNKLVDKQMEINKKMKAEKDPVKKAKLIEESRSIGNAQETVAQGSTALTETQNPFLNQQELEKASGPLTLEKGSALRQQLADSTNIASYAVPMGKGSNILTKAVLPGGTAAGMQKLSEAGNKDVSVEDVVGSVALGATGAGALYGVGKVGGALSKGGKGVTKTGEEISQGVRQMKLPGEVGGAQKEEFVNSVLDDLGFKGTPAEQYKMLQPKMTEIEGKIRPMLTKNSRVFAPSEVHSDIIKTLDGQGLLVGDKAKAQAQEALDDVMGDVINKGKQGQLSSEELFGVKQKLNAISNRLKEKADRGAALTPKEEVLMASRDALDRVITQYHPEVKELTLQQSALFDASKPLARARSNPPTLRAAGFSIPAGITTRGQQAIGGTTKAIGNVTQTIGNTLPNILVNQVSGQIAARVPSLAGGIQEQANNEQQGTDPQTGQQNTNTELNSLDNHGNTISPQSPLPPVEQKPNTLNALGWSPEEIYREAVRVQNAGFPEDASKIMAMYEDEVKHQTLNNTKAPKTLSDSASKIMRSARSGNQAVDEIEAFLGENSSVLTGQGGVFGRKILRGQEGKKYDAVVNKLKLAIKTIDTGADASGTLMELYEGMIPAAYDDPETVAYKLGQLREFFQTNLDPATMPSQQTGSAGQLPSIPMAY